MGVRGIRRVVGSSPGNRMVQNPRERSPPLTEKALGSHHPARTALHSVLPPIPPVPWLRVADPRPSGTDDPELLRTDAEHLSPTDEGR